jgi:hypothetical protein
MSDSKHRSNSPPSSRSQGSAPSSSSASNRQAVTGSHGSSSQAETAPHTKKPKVPLAEENQSGRVKFDARGNPVWEWQTAPGVFDTNVTTQRLKKLESPELGFADTQPVPTLGKKAAAKDKSKEDTGFNPYNSDAPMRPRTDRKAATHPALVHKRPPSARKPEAPPKEESVWGRFKSKFT